jgi:UDP-N-acetylglucosamine 2-epimerase (non-hydrolysing)
MGTSNVTLRDVTERPETIEAGSNILSGSEPESILRAIQTVLTDATNWRVPPEYQVADVSGAVVRIVLGHLELRPAPHDRTRNEVEAA